MCGNYNILLKFKTTEKIYFMCKTVFVVELWSNRMYEFDRQPVKCRINVTCIQNVFGLVGFYFMFNSLESSHILLNGNELHLKRASVRLFVYVWVCLFVYAFKAVNFMLANAASIYNCATNNCTNDQRTIIFITAISIFGLF